MRSKEQVDSLDGQVDFIGFIFYEKSKRFVTTIPSIEGAQKTGVFVNESIEEIVSQIEKHTLDVVQLHGNETPEMCAILKQEVTVIKAFGVNRSFDFAHTGAYSGKVDYFLFDTKTDLHGGSGKQFDWSVLSKYQGTTPFFLSGGINSESVESIRALDHSKLVGVDLNSGFEHAPGNKDVSKLKQFIKELKK